VTIDSGALSPLSPTHTAVDVAAIDVAAIDVAAVDVEALLARQVPTSIQIGQILKESPPQMGMVHLCRRCRRCRRRR